MSIFGKQREMISLTRDTFRMRAKTPIINAEENNKDLPLRYIRVSLREMK